jgi:hypothetical protein
MKLNNINKFENKIESIIKNHIFLVKKIYFLFLKFI